MQITALHLRNFKVFQDLSLDDLPALAVFVGANGSGKSTLFEVFDFLALALEGNVTSALAARGGFREVCSRGSSGPIIIEMQFRLPIMGKERTVTYHLEILERNGKPIIDREFLRYKRGPYGSPYHFLDFSLGKGYTILNEDDFSKEEEKLQREEQELSSPDILAIKGLGQFEKFKAANAFRLFLEQWHVSNFQIDTARSPQDAGYAEQLNPREDNLALVAQYIFQEHPQTFEQVLEKMRQRVPGIEKVEARSTEDGRIVLKFSDQAFEDPFTARFVSDGTIKMFAYLLLLYHPQAHPLLCIEEPENQLYPALLQELLEEFRAYAERGGQVMITTHSPDLLNAAQPEEVFTLFKEKGRTRIQSAQTDPHVMAQFRAGNPTGYQWSSGMLEPLKPSP